MTAGRPTDYSEEKLQLAKDYIASVFATKDDYEKVVTPPNMAKLAGILGVTRKTLYNWAAEHPEFLLITEQLQGFQEEMLIDRGLTGQYNSAIAKLILGKHGYTDKTDVTSDGKQIFTNLKDTPDAELENLARGGATGTSA